MKKSVKHCGLAVGP